MEMCLCGLKIKKYNFRVYSEIKLSEAIKAQLLHSYTLR